MKVVKAVFLTGRPGWLRLGVAAVAQLKLLLRQTREWTGAPQSSLRQRRRDLRILAQALGRGAWYGGGSASNAWMRLAIVRVTLEDNENTAESLRRFDIALLIVHPTIEPAEISSSLTLEGHFIHKAGELRKTPTGKLLEDRYADNRWRHRVRYEVRRQHFSSTLKFFVGMLQPHQTFLHRLRESGGRVAIVITFLNGYFGDELCREALAAFSSP